MLKIMNKMIADARCAKTREESESMPTGNEIVGRNVIRLRAQKGISQAELGRTSPVSQRTISNIEKLGAMGTCNIDTVEMIANYFKVPLWQMFLEDMPLDATLRKRLHAAIQTMISMSDEGLAKVVERIEEIGLLEALKKR